jgi:GTP-binding protein LepA
MNQIRNFAIIAHVDHGKSTLADRLMELTGTVDKNAHEAQMLDRNPISRERGITIKLAPVRMKYSLSSHSERPEGVEESQTTDIQNQAGGIRSLDFVRDDNQEYILNLIDTPGHVDFSYEVDRTLACVEGVILLVDASQGIQAQTISNAYKALEKDLVIIPVINKIDLDSADIEKTKKELIDFLGVREDEIIGISAKTGQNVERVLDKIISDIPAPKIIDEPTVLKALIFDSYFDSHKGVVAFVRIFDGTAARYKKMRLAVGHDKFEAIEVGIFTPDLVRKDQLVNGEIGYIVTNMKDIHNVRVGDTITDENLSESLPGYKQVKPMVYASVFPTDPTDFENLKKALEKIYLNDSALTFQGIYSTALGAGFRVGFLGLLHADVVRERLEREYDLSLVLTPPQADYIFKNDVYEEPIVKLHLITPEDYLGTVMKLCEEHRAKFITMDNKNQVYIEYLMPLSEMIADFFDQLKSITSGYASFDWEFSHYEKVDADKLSIMINLEEVEEFSEIVVPERAQEKAYFITKKLRELIPRQQFDVRVQAKYKGRIIASERIAPYRKDVLIKSGKVVGAGDYTRKKKLLEKQKKGKKKMKMIGKVEIPKEAFMKLFKR